MSSKYTSLLLAKGYFPRELPNVFTTADFGRESLGIKADWERSSVFSTQTVTYKASGKKPARMSGAYTYKLPDTDPELISVPKRGYERRNLSIVHPVSQLLLAHEMSANWASIQKWISIGRYSLDRIEISDRNARAVGEIGFATHRAKKGFIESTSDWLVKTDISRFYPSIYTHSISWAAYGKETVKGALGKYKGSLADRIDVLLRSGNRNQTVGIPIGPETSRIIAEILSSRIDHEFSCEVGDKVARNQVDRLQDDWFVGIPSLGDAETVLSAVRRVYRNFGLEINGSKTSIDRTVEISDPAWLSHIGSFLAHRSGPLQSARLREFLSLTLRLQAENPTEPVIGYALSVIESTAFASDDIESLESFLLKSVAMSPGSLDKICRVLINMDHSTSRISKKRVVSRFVKLLDRALENGNMFEAIWLAYTIRGIKQPLDSRIVADLMEEHPGAALPLILLDMKAKGLFPRSLPTGKWEAQMTEEAVGDSWIWLLAYEGTQKGWLADKKGLLSKKLFKPMHDRNVVFYDPKRNVESLKKATTVRRLANRRVAIETQRLLALLRGFSTNWSLGP